MQKSIEIRLIDLTVALVIVLLFAAIAVPSYGAFANKARVATAIGEIGDLSIAIEKFGFQNDDRIPMTLDEIGIPVPLDPWGQPYEFLNIVATSVSSAPRRDRALNLLNSDFDLYSRGRDGESAVPLSAKQSRDDILRANNGAYIGLGEDY